MMRIDARILVVLGSLDDAGPGDALLLGPDADAPPGWTAEHVGPASPHAAGCLCCTARSPVAEALGRLFLRRARGEAGLFHRVVAVGDGRMASEVQAALASDAVAGARYRFGG